MADELTGSFRSGQGGVMTDDVGVVTGDLTIRTQVGPDGETAVSVQYTGAEEWYALTGGRCRLADPRDAAAVHDLLLAVLARGGEGSRS